MKFIQEQTKIEPGIRSQKFNSSMVKLGNNFEKSGGSTVILKNHRVTPQLDQNLKPTSNLSGHFSIYIYFSIYWCSV